MWWGESLSSPGRTCKENWASAVPYWDFAREIAVRIEAIILPTYEKGRRSESVSQDMLQFSYGRGSVEQFAEEGKCPSA